MKYFNAEKLFLTLQLELSDFLPLHTSFNNLRVNKLVFLLVLGGAYHTVV